MIHLRTDAMAAEKRVDTECKIECRAVGRHRLELPFGCNYEDFRGVEVQFDGIEEVQGVRLWVVQDFFDGVEPFFQFVFAVCCRFAAFFIFPMSGKSLLCHLVHSCGADLHFYPLARLTHERDMQSLVAIGFRVSQPIAQPFGMRLVYTAGTHVDAEAFADFVFCPLRFEDDSYGQNVVDFFELDMLVLHLAPNGIRCFDACFDGIGKPHLIQCLADGAREIFKEGFTMGAGLCQFVDNLLVFLRMLVPETQVFQFFFDFVQSETVGQRRINIKSFPCYLILFVGGLRA